MLLYHGTNNKEDILIKGFKMNDYTKRFGNGFYFTPFKNVAMQFGSDVIMIELDESNIKLIDYNELAKKYNLSIEEEEGYPEIELYAKENNIDALIIGYDFCDYEVVVYNQDKFNIIF